MVPFHTHLSDYLIFCLHSDGSLNVSSVSSSLPSFSTSKVELRKMIFQGKKKDFYRYRCMAVLYLQSVEGGADLHCILSVNNVMSPPVIDRLQDHDAKNPTAALMISRFCDE